MENSEATEKRIKKLMRNLGLPREQVIALLTKADTKNSAYPPVRIRKPTEKSEQYYTELYKRQVTASKSKQTIRERLEAKYVDSTDASIVAARKTLGELKDELSRMEYEFAPLPEYVAKLAETSRAETAYVRAMKAVERAERAAAATGGGSAAARPIIAAPVDEEEAALDSADAELMAGLTDFMGKLGMGGGYRKSRKHHRKSRKARKHRRKSHKGRCHH